MSTTKAALKAIAASVQASKYPEAIQQAQQLLERDASNYQANLFLGFALDKQGKLADAEQAYHTATRSKPEDPQAWQGLIKLFEKQGSNKLDAYQDAVVHLSLIYGRVEDLYKSQDVVDKFIAFAKAEGNKRQERNALNIMLPTSPLYDLLEGRIPHPGVTYERIIQLTEADEKERTNKEIGERRTRLGAKLGQVTLEVRREIFQDSPLSDLYRKIIDWTNDDMLRRTYEEKLLARCYDYLLAAPPAQKETERRVVDKLARDMVIIKHPYKLAWDINLEWQDHALVEDWDVNILREYISFFPASGLGKVLQGFITSEMSPFPPPPPTTNEPTQRDDSDTSDDEGGGAMLDAPLTTEDRLMMMIDGMSDAPNSIFGYRLMGQYYAFLEEHEAAVEHARSGLHLITAELQKTGLSFSHAHEVITTQLATALVFYQSPRNHPEAKQLFDQVLVANPSSTSALIGVGLIFEEEEDYPAAVDFLERALKRDPSNIRVKAEAAWVRARNGEYERGANELEACLEEMKGEELRTRDLRAQTQYRIGFCLWEMDSSTKARKDRNGAYAYFLAALKSNLNFAPAYTSLGIYYSDYSKDKKRARKCFQKAFELSPSEVTAAERLARAFAEQGEWDLVEIVSQRVVDSGKVRPAPGSKKKGFSWPFAALGIAELNKQDYAKSIVSFQSALRITPDDYHCWVGLGESYHNSGRHVAATRAFTHAEKFESTVDENRSGETWFAKYMLANVKMELGDYEDAIESYQEVLKLRPNEFGVSIALLQTLVERAWDSIEKGLFGQAAHLAAEAISLAGPLTRDHAAAFNLWKALGDACSVFSYVQNQASTLPSDVIVNTVQAGPASDAYELFSEVDNVDPSTLVVGAEDEEALTQLTKCLHASILCHKRALHASASDIHAQAVAYYNLGWSEHRAHTCLASSLKKRSTRYQKASIRCFKRAIELEAGNAEFWNALGVVTSEHAPSISQHAFVRSLHINERNVHVWTNLGTLYLSQSDWQLAHEAFNRAQSTDPDYAHAWIGQGLVALLYGDPKEAQLLFTHAMEISESSSVITRQQYAVSTFDHIITSTTQASINDLVQPIFVLNQLASLAPHQLPYQHLASLYLERVTNISAAVGILDTVCTKIEADFEITESPASLSRFALAKADLARCQLASEQYESALENAETALELSAADAGNDLTPDARRKCRLSAHLTLGLASYYTDSLPQAMTYLEAAISESSNDPDCICLLAQILWATNTDTSRARAQEILFDCIESHPEHVDAILILGTISLLSSDTETLTALTPDLTNLSTLPNLPPSTLEAITQLLHAIASLASPTEALTQVQASILMYPHLAHTWSRLAGESEEMAPADMALKVALKAVARGELEAEGLAGALEGVGSLREGQVGAFVAPWVGGMTVGG